MSQTIPDGRGRHDLVVRPEYEVDAQNASAPLRSGHMDPPPHVLTALTSPRGRAAVASGAASAILRVVRQELNLRQADLAARSGYSQATVSRVEQGQVRDTTVIGDLADALQIPCNAFGGHAGFALSAATLEDMERRRLLEAALGVAAAAMLPAAVADPAHRKGIGTAEVNDCWKALDRLHGLEQQQGGAVVYELTTGMAARLRSTLGGATYGLAVGRKLRQVTAATMVQAGWQAYDARRHDVARRWWLESLHLADLGDGVDEHRVSALASLAREAADGVSRGREAVGLAQSAARVKGASPHLRSLLAAREALGHAAIGDRAAAVAALSRARRWLDQDTGADHPAWLRFWGPSDLAFHEMHAARLAGDGRAALRSARDAVTAADARAIPRNYALSIADLGSELARAGQYDEAIAVSRPVLSSSVINGSFRLRAELRDTARLLSSAPYAAGRDFAATVERLVPVA